jgi:protein phosphatase PTC7
MTASNLGDSGFLLLRFDQCSGEPYILIRSREQTHSFNTPFQLTKLPGNKEVNSLKKQNKSKELTNLKNAISMNRFCEDKPEDSDIYQIRVREGDLLLLATDGVFDNLFQDEILRIVTQHVKSTSERTKQSAKLLS